MATIQTDKTKALQAYSNGTAKEKSLLEKLFGKITFSPSILERINGLKDACKDQGIDCATLFDGMTDEYKKAELAMETIAKSLREGASASDCYYYSIVLPGSGGGFSYHVCIYDLGSTLVSPRLRLDTAEKAEHLGKCMLNYYKTYLTGN